MKIVAIDTATECCSAALRIDDDCLSRSEISPRQHTRLILPMVDELLAEASLTIKQMDAIAFGRGPGAFTGVRIAVGVIQGLAFAHDLPVIPISSLAALAQQFAVNYQAIAVAVDARMQEVYWGLYQRDSQFHMQLCEQERVCRPEQINSPNSGEWYAAGTGWDTYQTELTLAFRSKLLGIKTDAFPLATEIAELATAPLAAGKTIDVMTAAPVYLRNNVVNHR